MKPGELAHELEKIYGEELKSVVLYGSAATKDYSEKFSDYNVFCVLASPTPASLAKANPIVRRWVKKGNPAPHFFGPEHMERALDVFPIEFLDMQERYRVLFGVDPLKGVKLDPKNLRHQIESELRGKLLYLRAFYAANCHDPREVAKKTVASFPTFMAAFRAMLRMEGENPPEDARAVIEEISQRVEVNPEVFFEINLIRSGESLLPRKEEALLLFERYLTELDAITTYVDRM